MKSVYEANDDMAMPRTKVHKLVFVTGIWQRHDIFKMFAEGVKVLQDHFKHRIDIHVAVSGSEGALSEVLVNKFGGFHYVETPNQPLGEKMNKALQLAKSLKPDYCLMLGSDDIIGINLMGRYLDAMDQYIDYVSLLDCYFFDVRTKQGLYWAGYTKPHNKGKSAGIGKLISSSLLEKIKWNCFPPGFDRVLDTGFEKALQNIPFSKIELNLNREKLFALDIKSATNMTPFARWDNTVAVNGEDLLFKNLPKHLAKMIYG